MALYAVQRLPVRPLAKVFKALGDDTRLKILAMLTHGELCVCHIEDALAITQSAVSRHLGVLRNAGLVDTRRQGTWIHYRLAKPPDDTADRIIEELVTRLGDSEVKSGLAKIVKTKGPEAK